VEILAAVVKTMRTAVARVNPLAMCVKESLEPGLVAEWESLDTPSKDKGPEELQQVLKVSIYPTALSCYN
jgi:hypothetical protein